MKLEVFLNLLPEISVVLAAFVLLIVEIFNSRYRAFYSYLITISALILGLIFTLANMPSEPELILNNALVVDKLGAVAKAFILLVGILVLLYSRDYLKERSIYNTEYFALALFAILGAMIMAGGSSVLSLYLGLELMSLSLYAMVAFLRNSVIATEAAIKYFVLGAIATGMLLYGISFIYGIVGSFDLATIAQSVSADSKLSLFAMGFILVGLVFKLGAAPFHMWVPDVYQGSPTSVTSFISTIPKIATFVMIMRLLAEGLSPLSESWQQILIVIAIVSIGLGNVVAIAQSNIKRMLAYSGISHAGFFLLGILAGTESSYAAAMFYIIVYALTTAGAFGIVLLLSRKNFEAEQLADYKGLARRQPWYAFLMLILMFSMAGVPPTVGFYAKLSVLKSVVAVDLVWLAAVAVLFAIIGAFYYLRVVIYMYFHEAEEEAEPCQIPARGLGSVLSVNVLSILALGFFPAALMALCVSAVM